MVKRTTMFAVRHNGTLYGAGVELELDDGAAAELEAIGALAPLQTEAGKPAAGRRRGKVAELDLDAEANTHEVQFGGGRSELDPGDL